MCQRCYLMYFFVLNNSYFLGQVQKMLSLKATGDFLNVNKNFSARLSIMDFYILRLCFNMKNIFFIPLECFKYLYIVHR